MNVLLCGANGFVGRHVAAALEAAGHRVRRGARHGADVAMDFARDTQPAAWMPRLQGVQAVVNTVGVLRDSARSPMQAVHGDAPCALFEACVRQGVRRVIHVSALGIEEGTARYATTKRSAQARLLALSASGQLDGIVLRPSIVFGPGGASAALFLALARLPLLLLPRPVMTARVQPLHVRELAQAVAALLTSGSGITGALDCTGLQALTLADFIASLRQQLGYQPARVGALPDVLTKASAVLGDAFPWTPWGSETLALLGKDNTADSAAFARLLGRHPTPYNKLLAP